MNYRFRDYLGNPSLNKINLFMFETNAIVLSLADILKTFSTYQPEVEVEDRHSYNFNFITCTSRRSSNWKFIFPIWIQ